MKYQPRMKPQIDAWRYEFGKPIPTWVSRRAHQLRDEEALTVTAQNSYLSAAPGNWIARMGDEYFVFTDEEFHAGFEPVPDYDIDVRDGYWRSQKITCTALAEWIADQATNSRQGLIQRVAEAIASDRRGAATRALRGQAERVLPCTVIVEPATHFTKGIKVGTLLDAIERRREFEATEANLRKARAM